MELYKAHISRDPKFPSETHWECHFLQGACQISPHWWAMLIKGPPKSRPWPLKISSLKGWIQGPWGGEWMRHSWISKTAGVFGDPLAKHIQSHFFVGRVTGIRRVVLGRGGRCLVSGEFVWTNELQSFWMILSCVCLSIFRVIFGISTIVNHHVSPPFGTYILNFFQPPKPYSAQHFRRTSNFEWKLLGRTVVVSFV